MQCPVDRLEFRRVLQKQFDFRWEAYNLSQFSFNFIKEIKRGNKVQGWLHGGNAA